MGSVSHVPLHLEPVAETQLLDALIDARELELFFQAQRTVRVAQGGAEQVGEIFHRFLGARGIAACERGDRIHAVEQKMWPNARLQRLECATRASARTCMCHWCVTKK